jgi:hypothetical protein
MILDLNAVLDSSRALTVTAVSTGVYDVAGLGVNVPAVNITGIANGTTAPMGEDIGGGGPSSASPPQLGVIVGTNFTAGGAATLQVQLQAAVDSGNGVPGTWDTIVESDTIPVADLITTNNPIVSFTVPRRYPGQGFPRFYRLNYVIATGPMTAGVIAFAGLLTGIDDIPTYPANY